ncbi:MAG: hypothetical protein ACR2M4_12655, partial [Actinomycetota bacterium]
MIRLDDQTTLMVVHKTRRPTLVLQLLEEAGRESVCRPSAGLVTQFLAILEKLQSVRMLVLGFSYGPSRKEFEEHGWIEESGHLLLKDTRKVMGPSVYTVRLDAFFDHLTRLLDMEPYRAARRRCLVPEHLWYLGDLRIQGTHVFAPVFVGRLLVGAPTGAIHRALSDPIFERSGMVLNLSSPDLALPNGHQLRSIEHFLIAGRDGEEFDLAAVDRVLRGLPAGPSTESDAWFDYRTGRLMLPHFEHVEKLTGTQLDIIKVFWTVPRRAELEGCSSNTEASMHRSFGEQYDVFGDHDGPLVGAGQQLPGTFE